MSRALQAEWPPAQKGMVLALLMEMTRKDWPRVRLASRLTARPVLMIPHQALALVALSLVLLGLRVSLYQGRRLAAAMPGW